MSLPRKENCVFCQVYEAYRHKAQANKKTKITFWCALRMKTHQWKKSTYGAPLFSQTLKEVRLHYCPNCGRLLTACRQDNKENGII